MIWSRPRDRSPVARRCNPNKSTAFPPSIQPVRSTRSFSFVTLYRSSHSSYPDLLMLSKLPLDSGAFNLRDYCQLLRFEQYRIWQPLSTSHTSSIEHSSGVPLRKNSSCQNPSCHLFINRFHAYTMLLYWAIAMMQSLGRNARTSTAQWYSSEKKTDWHTDNRHNYVDVIKPVCWSKMFYSQIINALGSNVLDYTLRPIHDSK